MPFSGTGVQAFSLHPGGVKTDLGRYFGDRMPEFLTNLAGSITSMVMLSAEQGARTSLYCALEDKLSQPDFSGS